MNQIKIGLNSRFPKARQKDHTIVEEIRRHPPKGIIYDWAFPKPSNNRWVYTHPKYSNFDCIESSDNPLITNNKWIYLLATIEFALSYDINGVYFDRKKRIEIIRKILKKDNFKKLIFFSKAGLQSLTNYAKITDKDIINKSAFVYNAVPDIDESLLNKKKDKFKILFIGTAFYLKGGSALVDAFELLQKKYPFIELEIHSSLMKPNYLNSELYQPLDHNNTLKKIRDNSSIHHFNSFEIQRQEILKKVYPEADLFILPSMQEGMPYVLQEAMAYGIPIISTNCVASIPEIVENEKNGLIINVNNKSLEHIKNNIDSSGKRIITKEFHDYLKNEIVNKISALIENTALRNNIRKNNILKAKTLFSFKTRNRIMRQIYEGAVR
ncbi:glycosyltransferase family 4 protein [Candidatus Woesearchaeota archaeon]|nr:glycosyltransferase family 4 protein [Candidatus Woesearchaeota archaeon]